MCDKRRFKSILYMSYMKCVCIIAREFNPECGSLIKFSRCVTIVVFIVILWICFIVYFIYNENQANGITKCTTGGV